MYHAILHGKSFGVSLMILLQFWQEQDPVRILLKSKDPDFCHGRQPADVVVDGKIHKHSLNTFLSCL